jgi:hypothetical protein
VGDPSLLRRAWIGGSFVLAGALAACSFASPARLGDPAAPVIVRGTVRDSAGAPIAGAILRLRVLDYANPQHQPEEPVVYANDFVAKADGSFEIHLAATPALEAFAKTYSPWVAFDVTVLGPFESVIASTQFSRQLQGGAWVDSAPVLEVTPRGVTFNGVAPQPPAPAET